MSYGWKKLQKWMGVMGAAVLMLVCAIAFADIAKAETTGDWEGAKKAIIKAYKDYETEVDVSSYNLNYKTEYEYLQSTMSTVVNETPYLFYADTRYSVSRNSSTNQIMKIGLGYTAEYKKTDGSVRKTKIKNTRVKLDAAIEEALLNVEPGMTKVEKALVLHDYLVRNTAYTQDTTKQYTEAHADIPRCQNRGVGCASLVVTRHRNEHIQECRIHVSVAQTYERRRRIVGPGLPDGRK